VTRYTVTWRRTALRQLAHIWNQAGDRAAVTQASHRVDQELAIDPDQKGRDYFGDRVLAVPPLWALYTVRPDDRMVDVLQVGRPGVTVPHQQVP
jgi:plasmid stabilization system protein ParE